jgi:hypothetical protein
MTADVINLDDRRRAASRREAMAALAAMVFLAMLAHALREAMRGRTP